MTDENLGKVAEQRMRDPFEAYEAIRAKAYQELKIIRIQENIREKIFKTEPQEIELNFYTEEAPEEPTDDMGALLSQCNASEFSDRIGIEEKNSSGDGNGSGEGDDRKKSVSDGHASDSSLVRGYRRISNLLKLEAECSGDIEEHSEEEGIDLQDLIDSEDAENDDAVGMFVADQARDENKELRRLTSQFSRRKPEKAKIKDRAGTNTQSRLLESFSDEDTSDDLDKIEFTELDQADFLNPDSHPTAPPKVDAVAVKAPVKFEADDEFFSNNAAALERLARKTEKKGFGFEKYNG